MSEIIISSNILNEKILLAVINNDASVLEVLLDLGGGSIDITSTPSLIFIALQYQHLDIVKVLLWKGYDVNCCDQYGCSLLYTAISLKDIAMMQLLIAHGADINLPNKIGWTPMHKCCEIGCVELIDILLEAKANINSKSHLGSTPLHIAACEGHLMSIKKLCDSINININACDNDGWTPLFTAAFHGHTDVVAYLITYGCDVEFFIAYQEGFSDSVIELIRQKLSSSCKLKIIKDVETPTKPNMRNLSS